MILSYQVNLGSGHLREILKINVEDKGTMQLVKGPYRSASQPGVFLGTMWSGHDQQLAEEGQMIPNSSM